MDPKQDLKDLVAKSNEILVVVAKNPTVDAVAAGLFLEKVLADGGKRVTTVCPDPLPQESKNLLGQEKVTSKLSRNFIITLTGAVGNVEKVSYYTDSDDLNLVVHPHPGAPQFTTDQIKYRSGGGDFDLIFVLNSVKLEDLGKFYLDEKGLFSKTPIVNIDRHKDNNRFGKINLVHPQASSISEIVATAIKDWGYKIDESAATNLLRGIESATNNFQSPTTSARAFEAAAFCLEYGAKRAGITLPPYKPVVPPTPPPQVSLEPEEKAQEKGELKPTEISPPAGQPKSDWLKPKIYKGGQLL